MVSDSSQSGNLIRGMLDFVFPPLCAGCGEYCERPSLLCNTCLGKIQTYENPFCLNCRQMIGDLPECPTCAEKSFLLFAYGNYVDPLKEIVAQFKFKGVTGPIPTIGEALCSQFRDQIAMLGVHALVPIPLHTSREHERGYNQAELFAKALASELDIPVDMQIIVRTKKRKEQARLLDHEREINIRGVFEAIADAEAGETVILVDDVVTGGHTVSEAKRILEAAGFSVPAAISIAHGL
jgi:ComF family protein